MTKILTLKKARKATDYTVYENNDYDYINTDGFWISIKK